MIGVRAIAVSIQAGVPIIAWGSPGTAKTSMMYAIGQALGRRTHVIIPAIHEPADFGGFPVPMGDYVATLPNGALWRDVQEDDIIFIDEASCAVPAVQAALLRPVLENRVGDKVLPRVSWVLAANDPEDAAGGWNLAPPLANRLVHLVWRLDARDWTDGMISGFPPPTVPRLPENWQVHLPQARAFVASFIRGKVQSLAPGVPKDESKAGKAWPSPRTWTMTSTLLAACASLGSDPDLEAALVGGCVGEGPGLEFLHWKQNLDLPDPEDLLKDPKSFKLPSRGDLQFAVLASVAAAVISNLNKTRWNAAWEVFHQAATQGAKDVSAASVRTLAAARKTHKDLPFPSPAILKPFMEILQAAGMLAA